MAEPRTYPHGVPSWVDLEVPDPDVATAFYGGLFGWTFQNAMPPGAPGYYLIASLDGQDVAAVGPGDGPWNTYLAVDDADSSATTVAAAGGTILSAPQDAGPGGRTATCADPAGAQFRLWQARARLGAQLANVPGSWNFSDLHTPEPAGALCFYANVFGWDAEEVIGAGQMLRVPGYGDHLASTSDPDIYRRQATAPAGFADVIGSVVVSQQEEPAHWHVTFSVADRGETLTAVDRLGGSVLSTSETMWARVAEVQDPNGARFTVSQFAPPSGHGAG